MKKIVSRGRVLGKNSSEFARMLEGSEGTKTFTLNPILIACWSDAAADC